MDRSISFNDRLDLDDNKKRINELIEADRKIIKSFRKSDVQYDNDESYLSFINSEKKRLEKQPYLQSNVSLTASNPIYDRSSYDNLKPQE